MAGKLMERWDVEVGFGEGGLGRLGIWWGGEEGGGGITEEETRVHGWQMEEVFCYM